VELATRRASPSSLTAADAGCLPLKYECVYLNAFETGSEARRGIGAWISCYNEKRPHSSHGLLTPAETYDTANQNLKAAA
jgi:putative transposase